MSSSSSSPRLVPACTFRDDTGLALTASMPERKGKLRKIADDGGLVIQQKKQRKKWSEEETQMLVTGCNTVRPLLSSSATLTSFQWGVGNWKAILKDPKLTFDNRSPVDLKDR